MVKDPAAVLPAARYEGHLDGSCAARKDSK